MIPIIEMQHDPLAEKLTRVFCAKTQNDSPSFYRLLVAYNFCKVASMMRVSINTHDRGIIPVNCYAINLGSSGFGKGHSTNIMEDMVLGEFRETFLTDVFPLEAEMSLRRLATKRAIKNSSEEEDELEKAMTEFDALGPLPFAFDSGTAPALKQIRQKLLMANAGALCLEMDELGTNLVGNAELFGPLLELYDVGKIKQKITKQTSESKRSEDLNGKTPANMMLYGTPSKLFDGASTERYFMEFVETGFGRRCFFGLSYITKDLTNITAEDLYNKLTAIDADQVLTEVSARLATLADPVNFGAVIEMSREVNIMVLDYKLQCERTSLTLPEHEEMKRAEMQHRYFKALKYAGALAFVHNSSEILPEHLYAGIRLAEDSGDAFARILKRERNYIRLAKYLAEKDEEVTHPELLEDLSFYPSGAGARAEMLNLAISWGYKNNIVIRKRYSEQIEFLKGEALKHTDMNDMIVAFSDDYAANYGAATLPFVKDNEDSILTLVQEHGLHFTNHYMKNDHRKLENVIPGFNMVVFDVDGTAYLQDAITLLDKYNYIIYTTKSHTDEAHRYRIVLPISHVLHLDRETYLQFIKNIVDTLPFEVDTASQPERKWACNRGDVYYQMDRELFDVMPFIPDTSRNEQRQKYMASEGNLTNLERWFVNNTGDGNRNNQLYKFGVACLDMGYAIQDTKAAVAELNSKLKDAITLSELTKTIFKSLDAKAKSLGIV